MPKRHGGDMTAGKYEWWFLGIRMLGIELLFCQRFWVHQRCILGEFKAQSPRCGFAWNISPVGSGRAGS